MDRGAWQAVIHVVTGVRRNLATKQPPPKKQNKTKQKKPASQGWVTFCCAAK